MGLKWRRKGKVRTANALGGTVRSWAVAPLKPRDETMVGAKY